MGTANEASTIDEMFRRPVGSLYHTLAKNPNVWVAPVPFIGALVHA